MQESKESKLPVFLNQLNGTYFELGETPFLFHFELSLALLAPACLEQLINWFSFENLLTKKSNERNLYINFHLILCLLELNLILIKLLPEVVYHHVNNDAIFDHHCTVTIF